MRKTIHGLLWNLEINHEDRPTSDINDHVTFDIMISYSHKDKVLCQQIYEELTKSGYCIWIDFDQMHGNVMDAMAQAIERSHTVIICMSDDYRKSNYCRAEAHYAFQRQLKIVPVLLQKHYKPDGWLLFLTGQLVYVDFTTSDLSQAMKMLFKELKFGDIIETNQSPVRRATVTDVQAWLFDHDLPQMARLLAKCNGRSLVYRNKYMKIGDSQQILKLLQSDSLRRTGQDLSLIQLSCFRSLMDEQKQLVASSIFAKTETDTVRNNS